MTNIDYSSLPIHCQEGMRDYIEHQCPTGGFLYAVLSNDLRMAFLKADDVNALRIKDYLVFLERHAPPQCYGSKENVERWLYP